MIHLMQSRTAWGSNAFYEVFKEELQNLSAEQLPLQQGLSLSSSVSEEAFQAMVINAVGEQDVIRVKAGIFYSGIIAGCSCSDDPSPMDLQTEYCNVECTIDKTTGQAVVKLLAG